MNVINAGNPKYFNISDPVPLEQEPGVAWGWIVLLYESFYAV